MSSSRTNTLAFLLALGMITAASLVIARQVVAFQQFPFDFDEANHANGALALALELRAHDLAGFLAEFFSQGFYPPGFSWLKAIAFTLFGVTPLVARLFSVAAFFLAMIAVYAVPLEIDERYGWLAGLTAAALTLTMQPLLITSAMVMMEAPGLLVTFTLLWLYLRALKRPTNGRLLGVSLLLTMTFLTKYTYGVIAVGALALMELSLLLVEGRESAGGLRPALANGLRRWLWLYGPFLLFLFVWFFLAGNIHGFLAYAGAQPPDQPWVTRQNILFYPLTFANQFLPSPLFALFSLAGLLWGFWKWRDAGVRLILIYFLVGSLIMTINLPKNPRFIVTVAPALHILSGLLLAYAAAALRAGERRARRASALFLALLLLGFLLSLPMLIQRWSTYPSLLQAEYETSPQSGEIVRWLTESMPPGSRFFLLNYWDQLSPQRIAWDLAAQGTHGTANAAFDDLLPPAALVAEPTESNIVALRQAILDSGVDYLVLFEGGAWGLPFWPEHSQAMAEFLEPVARESFQVSYYDTAGRQDSELLSGEAWERVKEDGRYTLHIEAIIYRIHPSRQP